MITDTIKRSLIIACAGICMATYAQDDLQESGTRGLATTSAPKRQTVDTGIGEKYAMIVGIGNYFDKTFNELPNAVNDADKLYQTITSMDGGFPPEHVILFTDDDGNESPGRANIESMLSSLTEDLKPEDTFLFYFAGHGVMRGGQLYLVPNDARHKDIERYGMKYKDIESTIQNSRIKRALIILDACHSGKKRDLSRGLSTTGEPVHATDINPPELFEELEEFTNRHVVFSSCSAEEESHEYGDEPHGAFTWFLLNGLTGSADSDGNGTIMLSELYDYTSKSVKKWASSNRKKQNPTRIGLIEGDISFGQPPRENVASIPKEIPPTIAKEEIDEPTFVAVANPNRPRWLPKMKPIKGGTFEIGTTDAQRKKIEEMVYDTVTIAQIKRKILRNALAQETRQRITVSDFKIGIHEVSNLQYSYFIAETGHRRPMPGDTPNLDLWMDGDPYVPAIELAEDFVLPVANLPVVNVSYADAQAYCKWLSGKTGDQYRLPTEAEWEYAAKLNGDTIFPWGDRWDAGAANVGRFVPGLWNVKGDPTDDYEYYGPVNSYEDVKGLHNMIGNVMEWCTGVRSDQIVARGGGWRSPYFESRNAQSYVPKDLPDTRTMSIGFRVVKELD